LPPLGVVRVVDDAEMDLAVDDEKTEKDKETHRECVEVWKGVPRVVREEGA
jgi:hypothetical protein